MNSLSADGGQSLHNVGVNPSAPGAEGRSSQYVPSQRQVAAPVMPQINVSDIVTGVVSQLQKPTRKIIEVRIFFDDGTFETFSSREGR